MKTTSQCVKFIFIHLNAVGIFREVVNFIIILKQKFHSTANLSFPHKMPTVERHGHEPHVRWNKLK
jgi:hypothetical protein